LVGEGIVQYLGGQEPKKMKLWLVWFWWIRD